jgi:hypothetical protein
MHGQKKLMRGAKFNRTHQTYIDAAVPYIKAWKANPNITKISMGVIVPSGAGQVRVKYQLYPHAIKATVRGQTAVQTFWLYGSDLQNVLASL